MIQPTEGYPREQPPRAGRHFFKMRRDQYRSNDNSSSGCWILTRLSGKPASNLPLLVVTISGKCFERWRLETPFNSSTVGVRCLPSCCRQFWNAVICRERQSITDFNFFLIFSLNSQIHSCWNRNLVYALKSIIPYPCC